MTEENKEKTQNFFDGYRKNLEKNIGDDVIALIEESVDDVKKFISTGSTLLDCAITNSENGGVPVGKITEIAGHEATGKTLLAMQICANAQKDGAIIIYLDTENALNADFAMRIGLDTTQDGGFFLMRPRTMDDVFASMFQLFEQMETAFKGRTKPPFPYAVLVWDSVASSPPKEDIEKENPDPTANIGLASRIISKNLKKYLIQSGRKNVAQIFVNQLRTRIGAFPGQDPFVTPGGKSIPYYSSVRIRLKSKGKIKNKDKEVLGIATEAEVKKTRFGPPHRKVDFGIYFTKGIDDTESKIDFLIDKKFIQTAPGGRNGKQHWVKGQKDDQWDRLQLKRKILTDEEFKKLINQKVYDFMVKDLSDPDKVLIHIED